MYNIGQTLIDTRTNKHCVIVDVTANGKGTLYTVHFGNEIYRRYYEGKLDRVFTVTQPTQDYSNVEFYDFKHRSRFADFESWLEWTKRVS